MILSLDFGSTSFKAAVYDGRLAERGRSCAEQAYVLSCAGQVEMDVAVCDKAAAKAVSSALASARIKPAALSAVSITSQAQTFAVFTSSCRPKTCFFSWQDTRAWRQAAALQKRRSLLDFAVHASFREITASLQLTQIVRIQQEHPGLIRPGDRVVGLPAYFVWRLCGVPLVDVNLACMSGLYSLVLRDWWPAALRASGLLPGQMPEVRPVGTVGALTRRSARAFGLPEGLPVVLAGNDQTAGAYGARLHEKGRPLLTLGTAHALYTFLKKPAKPGSAMIRGPYPGGCFFRMESDSCGGNVVGWACRVLGLQCDDFFKLAASSLNRARGVRFDPDLPAGTGAWRGLGLQHTRADMARAVTDALIERLVHLIRASGLRPDGSACLLLAGGGRRQPVWQDLLSRAFKVRIEPVDADPLLGAAAMAEAALQNNPA